jgi:hypothetical protein
MSFTTTFWIQLIGAMFGFFMFYFTFVKFKRRELHSMEFWFWSSLWIVMLFVSLIPNVLDPIIEPLNFYRRLDFFVVLGFFFLFALGFSNHLMVRKLSDRMEKVVREAAILNNFESEDGTNENRENKDTNK